MIRRAEFHLEALREVLVKAALCQQPWPDAACFERLLEDDVLRPQPHTLVRAGRARVSPPPWWFVRGGWREVLVQHSPALSSSVG